MVLVCEYASLGERRFFSGSAMENQDRIKTRPNSFRDGLELTAGTYGAGSLPQPLQPYSNRDVHRSTSCDSGLCRASPKVSSLFCADFMPAL